MTSTRQTKGSTSSESSPSSPIFPPSATKMQETRNKMPSASFYLLENLHFLQFFVADSVRGSIIIGRGDFKTSHKALK
ncbi:MAG: hypothetical protein IJN29_06070 [Akkermansia sp.]|nr:hypothetical protein [Akkermansia sp.]